jgi:hypothetical protein
VPHAAASKAMAASAATPPEALLLLPEVFNIRALPLVRPWLAARQMCEPIGGGDAGAWYCMFVISVAQAAPARSDRLMTIR